jgi:hypothetical protein
MGDEAVLTVLPNKCRKGESSTVRVKKGKGSPDFKCSLRRTSTEGTSGKMNPSAMERFKDG